jgi:hypothetical protein
LIEPKWQAVSLPKKVSSGFKFAAKPTRMPTEKEYTDSSYCICWASIHTNANEIAQSGPAALLLLEFENDDFSFRHSI